MLVFGDDYSGSGCSSLTSLPESLGNLASLTELSGLSECKSLTGHEPLVAKVKARNVSINNNQ